MTAEHRFATPAPVGLHVECGRGTVRLRCEPVEETVVRLDGRHADDVAVRLDGDQLTILPPRHRGLLGGEAALVVDVVLPTASRVAARLGSADLLARGTLRTVRITAGSGDVHLERVSDGEVTTGSGDLRIDEVRGEGILRLKSGSGQVQVDESDADLSVSTGSGDVRLGECRGPVSVKTGSGDLGVLAARAGLGFATGSGDLSARVVSGGRVQVKGASGDVRVGIPHGTPVWTDLSSLSGRLRAELDAVGRPEPGQRHVEVVATTVSGDIVLTRAEVA